MTFDFQMIKDTYQALPGKISTIRNILSRPLTLTEKILYSHLYDEKSLRAFSRGEDYVDFKPDRVAMQVGEATDQGLAVEFLELVKIGAIDDSGDHFANIVRFTQIGTDHTVELFCTH